MADAKPINEKIVEVHDRRIKAGYDYEEKTYDMEKGEMSHFNSRDKSKGKKLPANNNSPHTGHMGLY